MNPSLCTELFSLYGGDPYPPIPKDSLSFPVASPENPFRFSFNIDPARVHAISAFNWFSFRSTNPLASFKPPQDKEDRMDLPCALYLLPSYFNHSCAPNASREHFGNVMVIRAVQKIRKGEEIFLSYLGMGGSYKDRKKELKKWINQCECEICPWDRQVGLKNVAKREKLYQDMLNESFSITRSRRILKQIDDTYLPNYPSYRPESSIAHHALALALENQPMTMPAILEEAVQEEMNALDKLGILVKDRKMTAGQPKKNSIKVLPIATDRAPYETITPVMVALTISRLFIPLGVPWRIENWLRAALWCE
jgi:hypothetical protein